MIRGIVSGGEVDRKKESGRDDVVGQIVSETEFRFRERVPTEPRYGVQKEVVQREEWEFHENDLANEKNVVRKGVFRGHFVLENEFRFLFWVPTFVRYGVQKIW